MMKLSATPAADWHLFRAFLAVVREGSPGASQLGIARMDKHLVPVLHAEFMFSMDVWLAMHRDLRTDHRVRLIFNHLALELARYARTSSHEA